MNHDNKSQRQQFTAMLNRWQVWYRIRHFSHYAILGLIFALTSVIGFSLTTIFSGVGLKYGLEFDFYILTALYAGSCFSVGFGIIAYFWPVNYPKLTRFFDSEFQLLERSSTAEEILSLNRNDVSNPLHQQQIADALAHSSQINPDLKFFIDINKRQIILTLILLATIIILSFVGNPYFARVSQRNEVVQAIQNEISQLEALQKTINKSTGTPSEELQEIQELLENTIRQLEQAQTIEEAVAVLTSAEQSLQEVDEELENRVDSLKKLGEELILNNSDNGQNNLLNDTGQALSDGNLQSAAQELDQIDLTSLSETEKQDLAEQLNTAADLAESDNPQLAQYLRQAADSLRNGDLDSAGQSLGQAAQEFSQTPNQIESAQEASAQTGQAIERLLQTNQNDPQIMAEGGTANSNSPEGDPAKGQTGGQNGNQAGQQGNPGNGSGIGSSDAENSNIDAGPTTNNPISSGNRPGDGGERPFVPLEVGEHLGGSGSMDIFLPKSDTLGENVTGLSNASPGEPGGITVPYTEVFSNYAEIYREAVDSDEIPVSFRKIIRDYFSSLEP